MGLVVLKTLITSRKVSIYCGITFLEVVFKEKEKLILLLRPDISVYKLKCDITFPDYC
jgi:hypothetical protein